MAWSLLFSFMAWILHVSFVVLASDGDPLQDFCVADNSTQITVNGFPCKPVSDVDATDFASSLLRQPGNEDPRVGSAVNLATAMTFPALNTLGISISRIDYRPRGLNPPHTHPRATEVLFVAHGTLLAGFVSTSNKLFTQVLHEGDLFVIPRGLPHFEMNVDDHLPALAISRFNSQNPGVSRLVSSLFGADPPLPTEVLQTAFGIRDRQELERIIAGAPTS
ncbi:hypothetical protein KP509_12G008500 [Ceratopteris richardii]|uniref:Germin-like protein n=1 Tax=Ceratopteris richardii TaxID=49495 RepID=A0A8T2TGF1_CERRI|nr:hypothetical protein KP509_12G008500 [Ceratopteris richardii]